MTATFTSTGRDKAASEGQFIDAPEVDTEEDLPLVLEDAVKKPKEGKLVKVRPRVKSQRRPQEEQRLLLRKPHQIPNPPNHTLTQPLQNPSQALARLPPRTLPRPPPTNPPSLPPQTPMRMNPQLPPSMLRHTKQQAKNG